MSKNRIEKNWDEAADIATKFFHDKHMLTVAMVQFAEREKIRVLNQYRKERGEPLIDVEKEPSRYPGGQDFVWIIDPPTLKYSSMTTGRHS